MKHKITINEAVKLLENDRDNGTSTKPIWFVIGNNHPNINSHFEREFNSNVVCIDAGKCYNIRKTVIELAMCSLLGGIYC